jgi:hypothetical protein
MSVTFALFLCILLLTVLWPAYGIITASRRPVGTLADWHKASLRICWGVQRLYSVRSLSSGHGDGSHFHRQECHLLVRDLMANTLFIVNFMNNFAAEGDPRSSYSVRQPEITARARDVVGRGARLLLRLHWARLKLFCWPPAITTPRRYTLAVAERYLCLCLALTGLLERCAPDNL